MVTGRQSEASLQGQDAVAATAVLRLAGPPWIDDMAATRETSISTAITLRTAAKVIAEGSESDADWLALLFKVRQPICRT